MTAELVARAWSWRKAITRSGLPPTTRHVLLTLSLRMNEHGEGCFPSIEDLMDDTGLSKRAVLQHLAGAIEAGWLSRAEHGFRGRRWRRAEYTPAWPGRGLVADMAAGDGAGPEDGPEDARRDGADEHQAGGRHDADAGEVVHDDHHLVPDEVVHVVHRGGASDDIEVVHDVHRVREESIQESRRSPVEREARARAGPPDSGKSDRHGRSSAAPSGREAERPWEGDADFMALARDWGPIDTLAASWRAWSSLDLTQRADAVRRVPTYRAQHRTRKSRCALSTYLGERQFALLADPEPAEGAVPALETIPPRTRHWWQRLVARAEAGVSPRTAVYCAASHDTGVSCPVAEFPGDAACDALIALPVAFDARGLLVEAPPELVAWLDWLAARGAARSELRTARVLGRYIYVPRRWPDGGNEERGR